MKIFISIDGVLRNTLQKFDYHYRDYYLNTETETEETFEYGVSDSVYNENLMRKYPIFNYHVALIHFRMVLQ